MHKLFCCNQQQSPLSTRLDITASCRRLVANYLEELRTGRSIREWETRREEEINGADERRELFIVNLSATGSKFETEAICHNSFTFHFSSRLKATHFMRYEKFAQLSRRRV